jgi:hypothetical protein
MELFLYWLRFCRIVLYALYFQYVYGHPFQ